ncbi:response regulator transcription factor [Micromonospora sp. NBC_01796]|uniref:response regulator transcription factor n=1 Tax=Micromonospora sp. NBC_01796 TaxID=2975987 RepID=UPI002DD7DABE|nr:response regulator transcription factor [Micromonospora sp. NBC_01796]WSA88654.1 response regulator transcription factor [Micromonospora sp. NBC_01796]
MRVILAEDSTLLREGLARLLVEEGHEVVASVGDGVALVEAVRADPPDVVVADVRMPPTHTDEGLRAALEIRRRWPAVGVLVLSQYVEKRYAVDLLGGRTDGVGYLLKDRVVEVGEFLDALARVGTGGTAFDPEVVRQLLARTSHTDSLGRLTERERAVLDQMAQGQTNATIAGQLHVSQSAVEKHVNAIFEKLGLSHTTGYSRRVLAVLRYLGS